MIHKLNIISQSFAFNKKNHAQRLSIITIRLIFSFFISSLIYLSSVGCSLNYQLQCFLLILWLFRCLWGHISDLPSLLLLTESSQNGFPTQSHSILIISAMHIYCGYLCSDLLLIRLLVAILRYYTVYKIASILINWHYHHLIALQLHCSSSLVNHFWWFRILDGNWSSNSTPTISIFVPEIIEIKLSVYHF